MWPMSYSATPQQDTVPSPWLIAGMSLSQDVWVSSGIRSSEKLLPQTSAQLEAAGAPRIKPGPGTPGPMGPPLWEGMLEHGVGVGDHPLREASGKESWEPAWPPLSAPAGAKPSLDHSEEEAPLAGQLSPDRAVGACGRGGSRKEGQGQTSACNMMTHWGLASDLPYSSLLSLGLNLGKPSPASSARRTRSLECHTFQVGPLLPGSSAALPLQPALAS